MGSNKMQGNMTEHVELLSDTAAVLTKVTLNDMQTQLEHNLSSESCFTSPEQACFVSTIRKVGPVQVIFSVMARTVAWQNDSCSLNFGCCLAVQSLCYSCAWIFFGFLILSLQ